MPARETPADDSRERDRIRLTEREWAALQCELNELREKVDALGTFKALTAATLAEVVEIARRNDREILVFKTKAALVAAGWGLLWTILSAVITAAIIKFGHL